MALLHLAGPAHFQPVLLLGRLQRLPGRYAGAQASPTPAQHAAKPLAAPLTLPEPACMQGSATEMRACYRYLSACAAGP